MLQCRIVAILASVTLLTGCSAASDTTSTAQPDRGYATACDELAALVSLGTTVGKNSDQYSLVYSTINMAVTYAEESTDPRASDLASQLREFAQALGANYEKYLAIAVAIRRDYCASVPTLP